MVAKCAAVPVASLHVAALLGPVLGRRGLLPLYLGHAHALFDHPPSKFHLVNPGEMP